MRSVITTAGIVMLASVIQVDFSHSPLAAQDRVAGIVSAARKVLALRDRDPFPQGQFVDLKDL